MLTTENFNTGAGLSKSGPPDMPAMAAGVAPPDSGPAPSTTRLPDPEGSRRTLMDSIQEIMIALEQCETSTEYQTVQARGLLEEALDRRLAELRVLDAQIARATRSLTQAS